MASTPRRLDALPDLKIVICNGAGLDRIDLAAARAPQRRDLPHAGRARRRRRRGGDRADLRASCGGSSRPTASCAPDAGPRSAWPPRTRVAGKTMGIVGLGRIGRRAAQRARHRHEGALSPGGSRSPMCPIPSCRICWRLPTGRRAGAVVPGGRGDAEPGRAQRAGDGLVPTATSSTCRAASVVDEAALIAALQNGTIAGAALDVFASEPNIDPRFLELDNVVLQPHSASITHETRAAMIDRLARDLDSFLAASPSTTQRARSSSSWSVPMAAKAATRPDARRSQPQRGRALHPAREPVPPSHPSRPMGGRRADPDRRGARGRMRRGARHHPPGARPA